MSRRVAEIIILAEDRQHSDFCRHYLIHLGFDSRRIRIRPSPAGAGDAKNYVRQQYSIEVRAYRGRSSYLQSALLVLIDADTDAVNVRERELEDRLNQTGETRRTASEAIALLIPKRNIESWIECLTGGDVDEEIDYKRSTTGTPKAAASVFYDWSRPNYQLPAKCIPSLTRGITEVRRIP